MTVAAAAAAPGCVRRVMAAFEVVHHHAQVRHVLASLPKKTWQLATRSGEVPP